MTLLRLKRQFLIYRLRYSLISYTILTLQLFIISTPYCQLIFWTGFFFLPCDSKFFGHGRGWIIRQAFCIFMLFLAILQLYPTIRKLYR